LSGKTATHAPTAPTRRSPPAARPSQFALTLQPTWRRVSTSDKVRCTDGDPWELLLQKVESLIVDTAENAVNWVVDKANDVANAVYNMVPFVSGTWHPFDRACFEDRHRPNKECPPPWYTSAAAQHWHQCESGQRGLDTMCYYQRVSSRPPHAPSPHAIRPPGLRTLVRSQANAICTDDERLDGWGELFAGGSQDADQLQQEFADAFGDSYAFLDPTTLDLLDAVRTDVGVPEFEIEERKDICSGEAFYSSLKLDQIVSRDRRRRRRRRRRRARAPADRLASPRADRLVLLRRRRTIVKIPRRRTRAPYSKYLPE